MKQLFQLWNCIFICSNKACFCLLSNIFLQKLSKPKVHKNPFFKERTPSNIRFLNISVNHLDLMHYLETFEQILLYELSIFYIFFFPTAFHCELNAVIVAHNVVAEIIVNSRTKPKDRPDFIKQVFFNDFINYFVEHQTIFDLNSLGFDNIFFIFGNKE